MVAGALFNNLSSMLIFIVLARLLSPAEFGIVAFAAIFIDLSRVLVVAGIPDVLIQREDWDDKLASTAFWANLMLGVVISLILNLIVLVAVGGADGETLRWVVAALSLTLVIDGTIAVHTAKLRREFGYRAIAMRNAVAQVASGVVGIALAVLGFGVWALVISRLVGVLLSSTILWSAARWHPQATFSLRSLRQLRGSLSFLFSSLSAQANQHVAAFVVGAWLGPAALGQFRIGSRVLTMLINTFIVPLQTTAMSAFSRLDRGGNAVGSAYLRVTRLCSIIVCPVFLGLAAIAPDFVPLVFGEKWRGAGYVMSAMALVAGPAVLMYFAQPALAAAGKAQFVLLSNIASLIGNTVIAFLTMGWGMVAVAAGQSARAHLTLPFSLSLLNKGIGVHGWTAIRNILPPYAAAVVMALALTLGRLFLLGGVGEFGRVAIMVAVGPLLYAGALFCFSPRYLRDGLAELAPLVPARFRARLIKGSA
jgi:O-antigen/teichoic acid export membrane protein